MDDGTAWLMVSSGLGALVALVSELALLAVALTVVRRQSAAAGFWMAGAAGVFLLSLVWSYTAPLMARTAVDTDSTVRVLAVTQSFGTLLRAAGWAALLVGILKLARPEAPADPTRFG